MKGLWNMIVNKSNTKKTTPLIDVINTSVSLSNLLAGPEKHEKRCHRSLKRSLSFQFLVVLLIAFTVVLAMPRDESIVGEMIVDAEPFNPEESQIIFKLKKFKKLFLG